MYKFEMCTVICTLNLPIEIKYVFGDNFHMLKQ